MDELITPTICKICLEKDDLNELISPCKCSGSIKYVHPDCMKSWRTSLLECGRERDVYKCTLCQHRLSIKQRNPLRTLLNYKVARIIGTFLILLALLIPTGTLMKMIIHFSALLTNDHAGGWSQAWSDGRLLDLIVSSGRTALYSMITHASPSPSHVNYSPFAVCDAQPDLLSANPSYNLTDEGAYLMSHSIVGSVPLYALFFPFFDARLWQFLLCKLEHLHLGFFLFGSVANIWYTCHILSDMFDIVFMQELDLLQQHHNDNDNDIHPQPPLEGQHRHGSDIGLHSNETRLGIFTRQCAKLIKRLLVTYCCMLVALFWIHFNLLAFVVSESTDLQKGSACLQDQQQQQQQQQQQSPQYQPINQFLVELPLWTLRWVTLGVAVGSVMVKVIYPWLGRLTSCIDHETILSIPSSDD